MKVLTMLVMLASPALADQVVKPSVGIMLMRDSDGIVISVLHPVDYYTAGGVIGTGVVYMMDGHVLEFSAGPGGVMAGGVGPTAVVGGTTYQVEAKGAEVWLRDPVTGLRFATERRMAADATGLQVNPTGFALD